MYSEISTILSMTTGWNGLCLVTNDSTFHSFVSIKEAKLKDYFCLTCILDLLP